MQNEARQGGLLSFRIILLIGFIYLSVMKELLLINTIIISICTRVDVMRHVKSTSRGFLYARPTVIAYVGCGNSGNSGNSEDGVVLAPSPAPLFTFKLKVDFEVSVHKASLPPLPHSKVIRRNVPQTASERPRRRLKVRRRERVSERRELPLKASPLLSLLPPPPP